MTATAAHARRRDRTPDSHLFPTRPYDLVKEFVIALVVVGLLTGLLAALFSSPDTKAISLSSWAKAAPSDVVATAAAELAGTSTSASYGPPYNHAAVGQKLGPLSLQKWGGVTIPVNSAEALVIAPLRSITGDARPHRRAGRVGQSLAGAAGGLGRALRRCAGGRTQWRSGKGCQG